MSSRDDLGGIIHTYQKYDPINLPSPTAPPPDLVSPAFDHLLMYGNTRELTPEELARAVHIDPSQIKGLGPSLDALMDILRNASAKILATYETGRAETAARENFWARPTGSHRRVNWPSASRRRCARSNWPSWNSLVSRRQGAGKFARQLLHLVERLGEKYQVDELASKYGLPAERP